jgi:hypothetical protein
MLCLRVGGNLLPCADEHLARSAVSFDVSSPSSQRNESTEEKPMSPKLADPPRFPETFDTSSVPAQPRPRQRWLRKAGKPLEPGQSQSPWTHWIRRAGVIEWAPDGDPGEAASNVVNLLRELASLPRLPKNKVLYGNVPILLAAALKVAVASINATEQDSSTRWAVKVIGALILCVERHTWLQAAIEVDGPLQEELYEAMDIAARRLRMYRGAGAGVRAMCAAQRLTATAHEDFWVRLGRWKRSYDGATTVDVLNTYQLLIDCESITPEEHKGLWPGVERVLHGAAARMTLEQLVGVLQVLQRLQESVQGIEVPRDMFEAALPALLPALDRGAGESTTSRNLHTPLGRKDSRSSKDLLDAALADLASAPEEGVGERGESSSVGAQLRRDGQVVEMLEAHGEAYRRESVAEGAGKGRQEARDTTLQVFNALLYFEVGYSNAADAAVRAYFGGEPLPGRSQSFGVPMLHTLACMQAKLRPETVLAVEAHVRFCAEACKLPAQLGARVLADLPAIGADAAGILRCTLQSAATQLVGDVRSWSLESAGPDTDLTALERRIVKRLARGLGVALQDTKAPEEGSVGFAWLESELQDWIARVLDPAEAVQVLMLFAEAQAAEESVRQQEYPTSVFAAVEDGGVG